jgi:hypothetical protein
MRMNKPLRAIELWSWGILLFLALVPEALAEGLLPTLPSLWAPATVLGLTLITAARGDRQ